MVLALFLSLFTRTYTTFCWGEAGSDGLAYGRFWDCARGDWPDTLLFEPLLLCIRAVVFAIFWPVAEARRTGMACVLLYR